MTSRRFSEEFDSEQANALLDRAFPGEHILALSDIPTPLIMPIVSFVHKLDRYDSVILKCYGIVPGMEDRDDDSIKKLLSLNPLRKWLRNLLSTLVSRDRLGRGEYERFIGNITRVADDTPRYGDSGR